ncbi:MAG: helix-turn-helix domain-containing protein [Candidatus Gastranaerophilales bacterium]|nr:helix-turn-helix domain-containing protein [Candidatus Gastranaerophilales bacterium]MCM1073549.1 helix-turn-helix domain-containing protein [Bacteroides sp.]
MGTRAFKYDKILTRKFGQKIAFLRKNMNITQEELAFRINISPSYMSSIERGVTDTTISTAKRLAKALGISLSELFNI